VRVFRHLGLQVHVLSERYSSIYFKDIGRTPPSGELRAS
jgi:hypothetical protein